ncbi:hypothetical protein HMN09_00682400 [Mycena chlorophos]|uniref:Uncharacterized protein n=1 Tax=Mycena chlorophos TaxID=658473 RepID=A0A8H6W9R3_MYCCL|nr:hypothetical protein HMN09_00682400 [Mycena chlorophos]
MQICASAASGASAARQADRNSSGFQCPQSEALAFSERMKLAGRAAFFPRMQFFGRQCQSRRLGASRSAHRNAIFEIQSLPCSLHRLTRLPIKATSAPIQSIPQLQPMHFSRPLAFLSLAVLAKAQFFGSLSSELASIETEVPTGVLQSINPSVITVGGHAITFTPTSDAGVITFTGSVITFDGTGTAIVTSAATSTQTTSSESGTTGPASAGGTGSPSAARRGSLVAGFGAVVAGVWLGGLLAL